MTNGRSTEWPLVVFGDDWGRHVSTMQHLLRWLLPTHRVVWVNGIGHRMPRLAVADVRRVWEKARAMARGTVADHHLASPGQSPDIIVQPRVLPWHHRRLVERFNAWSLRRTIRSALREVGDGRPIVITGSPASACVLGRLDEVATVYFCMDDFQHLPGVSARMLAPLERRLLDRVDAVVATAQALTHLKAPRSGVVHYLPQGVNYDHFAAPRLLPGDLAALPRPRIGFAGGVGAAIDLMLIERIAGAFPQGSVVLVGPEQEGLGEIEAPNVHRLGHRAYDDLPGYVQGFDVGLIPYLRNPWTESVDPLKLLEYLAAGIPVVSTDLPEVRKYGSVVAIATDPDVFVHHVARALTDDTPTLQHTRQRTAAQHTWRARATQFVAILDELVASGVPRAPGID